jgi:uncharacterized repeat protein (TIGR03803 family)
MANRGQYRGWIFKTRLSEAAVALAIAILLTLTLISTQALPAQTFTVIHNFTGGQDGAFPLAGLTIDSAGNLYGTTAGIPFLDPVVSSASTNGTVFQLTKTGSGWLFRPLYDFAGGNDGSAPEARVAFGPDGSLYGTTAAGGINGPCFALPLTGCGTVFNLKPPATGCKTALCAWTETVVYRFTGGADGGSPFSTVVFDQAGSIYATTAGGGTSDQGSVFKLTPSGSTWTENVLYSFNGGNDGGSPRGGVIFDTAGNLYGTTPFFGANFRGTIFELIPSGTGWAESTLYSFQGSNDGSAPYASLIFDSSGNLYGATTTQGPGGGGTAFQLSGSGQNWTLTTLYSFSGNTGSHDNPVMDSAGNLFGTTYFGVGPELDAYNPLQLLWQHRFARQSGYGQCG